MKILLKLILFACILTPSVLLAGNITMTPKGQSPPPLPTASTTFNYTGAVQTYVVPAGYTAVNLDIVGSAAWTGTVNQGRGARVQTTIAVTPGETLYVYVGGTSGWPNAGIYPAYNRGGGSSDVRRGGNTTANIVAIAGGGGGMGNVNTYGGDGGNPGTDGRNGGYTAGYGGGGATQTAGGRGGLSDGGTGMAGTFFKGGDGDTTGTEGEGGCGGGGYYGGGGGGSTNSTTYNSGGGGGGSSWTAKCPVYTTGYLATGNGTVTITPTTTLPPECSGSGIGIPNIIF